MLDINYSNQSIKFLKKIDRILSERIINKIKDLSVNPFPSDSKSIKNSKMKLFRIRAGNFRILYEVDYGNNLLGIVKIDKRSKIYK